MFLAAATKIIFSVWWGRKQEEGELKKNAAQQTKIQIYFDFFFINRKINFARSAHSNTHTQTHSTHIQDQAEQQRQQQQQRESDAAGACSLNCVLRSHALSRALSDCLAPRCLPHSPALCVSVCV